MGKNRCGALGVIQLINQKITFLVESVVEVVEYEGMQITLPRDINVGDAIPLRQIAQEQRGLVIRSEEDEYVDEGEIRPDANVGSKLKFVSDYDGPLSQTAVETLVGRHAELKIEIYDQVGAVRRLRKIRTAFRS